MLNFFAPINNLGYGIHSYNLIKAYYRYVSKDISLTPVNGEYRVIDDFVTTIDSNRDKITKEDKSIMIFHASELHRFYGKERIGFPVFELEKFLPREISILKTLDKILVTSKWAKEVIEKNIIDSIPTVHIVNEGFDPEIFYKTKSIEEKLFLIEQEGISFVHVGKYEKRKNTLNILMVFFELFKDYQKNVTLTCHLYNPFVNKLFDFIEEEMKKLGMKIIGDKFIYNKLTIIIPRKNFSTTKEISELYKKATFGIWLSCAEGWNLPLMECLACGTPALTTNVTAMSEYITDKYPEYLTIKNYEEQTAFDNFFFKNPDKNWLQPDLEEAKQKIKLMVQEPEKYLREYENNYYDFIKKFTWANAAYQLYDIINPGCNCNKS